MSMLHLLFLSFFLALTPYPTLQLNSSSTSPPTSCRSYCGNLTISNPFSITPGCGHSAFRDLLFCINNVLLLHIPSGSYRVLSIDYMFNFLTLHDPTMSTCHQLFLENSSKDKASLKPTNGFVIDTPLAGFLRPSASNVFLLLHCRIDSPLFEGFPDKHVPCRNVSGMGCEDFSLCPSWDTNPRRGDGGGGGGGGRGQAKPLECCSVGFAETKGINLSRLGCEGYSSAYNLAPLRTPDAKEWMYGIKVEYTVPMEHDSFCRACEATGGACGYGSSTPNQICLCQGWNSTSNCDSVVPSMSISRRTTSTSKLVIGIFLCITLVL